MCRRPRFVAGNWKMHGSLGANRALLCGMVAELMLTRTMHEWIELLEANNVPCGPINNIDQVFDDPQVLHDKTAVEVDDPVLGKDPQPAHMKNYVNTSQDNGGVHINSGIPNRAFYLVATALGGNAWDRAGHIWYDTLRDSKLKTNAGFAAFAKLTLSHAKNAKEVKAVKDGWNGVGIPL